jgi:outer membrane protein assembly factor BamA
MRRLLVAVATLACGAAPAPLPAQRYWKETLYPLPYYSTTDGLWLWGHYGRWSPVGFEERPEPYLAAVNVDAGLSTQGSYAATVDFAAPAWWEGWRVSAIVAATRWNRLGYYGIGNATAYDSDSSDGRSHFYQASRSQQALRLTLQRRLVGPLRVLAGTMLTRTTYRELPGGSVFARDIASGAVDTAAFPLVDVVGRVGLVLDTRDHEIDPHQGLLGELLYTVGDGYQRFTASGRAYVRPAERLTLAVRLAGEDVRGDAPLPALTSIESLERPIEALGGYMTLRGYYANRFAGPGKLLGNIEARYALIWAPTLLEVKLVAFYEAGRVFGATESWRLTTDGLHASGGVELAARLQRNTLIAVGVATGDEGIRLQLGVGWSF